MFDIVHKHYHSDSKLETKISKIVNNITKVPHDPICQRCDRRFSYHGQKDDKCSGFVSTGTMIPIEQQNNRSEK